MTFFLHLEKEFVGTSLRFSIFVQETPARFQLYFPYLHKPEVKFLVFMEESRWVLVELEPRWTGDVMQAMRAAEIFANQKECRSPKLTSPSQCSDDKIPTTELWQKISVFRDLMDLPPCVLSASMDEVLSSCNSINKALKASFSWRWILQCSWWWRRWRTSTSSFPRSYRESNWRREWQRQDRFRRIRF